MQVEVYAIDPGVPHGLDDFARSLLAPAGFGLRAGYDIASAIGLVRSRYRLLRARRNAA